MALPTFHCPCCRNPLTFEVVLANESVRECILLLMDAHPSASGLLRPLLGYIGLFAPAKQAIRYERMASLLQEIVPMMRKCEITRAGRTYIAPLEYWKSALEEVLSRGQNGSLKTPLKSHGYLLEVIAQMASKADAQAEHKLEQQRQGVSGVGLPPERAEQITTISQPRVPMPKHVREQLFNSLKGNNHDS